MLLRAAAANAPACCRSCWTISPRSRQRRCWCSCERGCAPRPRRPPAHALHTHIGSGNGPWVQAPARPGSGLLQGSCLCPSTCMHGLRCGGNHATHGSAHARDQAALYSHARPCVLHCRARHLRRWRAWPQHCSRSRCRCTPHTRVGAQRPASAAGARLSTLLPCTSAAAAATPGPHAPTRGPAVHPG